MSTKPDQSTPSCPDWCSLPHADHPWDHHDHGRKGRGHQGPRFGPHVYAGSFEYADRTGVHDYDLCVDPEIETDVRTPEQARALAAALLAAAEWVEAQQQDAS